MKLVVLNVLVLSKIINNTLNYNPIVTELNSITIHFYLSLVQSGDYTVKLYIINLLIINIP